MLPVLLSAVVSGCISLLAGRITYAFYPAANERAHVLMLYFAFLSPPLFFLVKYQFGSSASLLGLAILTVLVLAAIVLYWRKGNRDERMEEEDEQLLPYSWELPDQAQMQAEVETQGLASEKQLAVSEQRQEAKKELLEQPAVEPESKDRWLVQSAVEAEGQEDTLGQSAVESEAKEVTWLQSAAELEGKDVSHGQPELERQDASFVQSAVEPEVKEASLVQSAAEPETKAGPHVRPAAEPETSARAFAQSVAEAEESLLMQATREPTAMLAAEAVIPYEESELGRKEVAAMAKDRLDDAPHHLSPVDDSSVYIEEPILQAVLESAPAALAPPVKQEVEEFDYDIEHFFSKNPEEGEKEDDVASLPDQTKRNQTKRNQDELLSDLSALLEPEIGAVATPPVANPPIRNEQADQHGQWSPADSPVLQMESLELVNENTAAFNSDTAAQQKSRLYELEELKQPLQE